MRISIAIAMAFSASTMASEMYPYASIGIGYKIDEAKYSHDLDIYNADHVINDNFGGNDTALFEVGIEYGRSWSAGLKHDSQWSSGAPFNSRDEYHKTEVFIRYKIGGRP